MNYEEIIKGLKKEQELDKELGKVGEGVDEQILSKRRRNGRDLDSLDGVLD